MPSGRRKDICCAAVAISASTPAANPAHALQPGAEEAEGGRRDRRLTRTGASSNQAGPPPATTPPLERVVALREVDLTLPAGATTAGGTATDGAAVTRAGRGCRGCAAFAICLAFLQPASAQVNAETDARAFIVREAEIRRQAAAAEQGQDSEKAAETAEAKGDSKGRAKTSRTSRNERTPLAAPAGSDGLRQLVARHAAANGVPFALADAVVRIESRYNPRAANAGNYGLMQIRHQTARGVGYAFRAS